MDLVIHIFLPLAVGIIMLSLGLGLTIRDFTRIVRWPKAFFVGLACQITLLPVAAFCIIKAFGITGGVAVGVMLLASCPGGNVSNLFTKFARGNVALSISLTAISSLLSVITIPVVLKWSESHFLQSDTIFLDLTGVASRAFLLSVLPIIIGVSLRHLRPAFADKAGRVLTKVAVALLAIIIIGAVIGNWQPFIENLWLLGTSMVTLFFLLTGIGLILPLALGLDLNDAKTISIEAGIQNGALGITVATLLTQTMSGFNDYSLASAIYGVLVYFTITPLVLWYRFMKIGVNQKTA